MASNPRFAVALPKYDEWTTSVDDIPRDLDEDAFEDWLWRRSKKPQDATGSGKTENTNEAKTESTDKSKSSKKKKKNRKNKQKKRNKKKNKSQQPEEEDIESVKSEEITKTSPADNKKQQGGSGPFANLRGLRSFPTFSRLPEENLLDLTFYKNIGVGYVPRHHWCFLGEIVDIVPTVRLNLNVMDASGEMLLFAFHTDGRGHEVEPSKVRVGNTVALLYATRHDFMFSPTGIRHEEPSSFAVCWQPSCPRIVSDANTVLTDHPHVPRQPVHAERQGQRILGQGGRYEQMPRVSQEGEQSHQVFTMFHVLVLQQGKYPSFPARE